MRIIKVSIGFLGIKWVGIKSMGAYVFDIYTKLEYSSLNKAVMETN